MSQIEPNFIEGWDFDLFYYLICFLKVWLWPSCLWALQRFLWLFCSQHWWNASLHLLTCTCPQILLLFSFSAWLIGLMSFQLIVCYICMCWSCTITVTVTRPLWPTNLFLHETVYPSPQTHSSYSCYCKHPPCSSWEKVERVKINASVDRNNWKRPNPSWYGSRQVRWWRLGLSVCSH